MATTNPSTRLVGGVHLLADQRPRSIDEIAGEFDLESHLQDSWKLIKGEGSYDVVLHFDPSLTPLILNARHHPGETTQQLPNGTFEYRVQLSSLEEISRWIVGFGGKCRVVGPEELMSRVRELATSVLI